MSWWEDSAQDALRALHSPMWLGAAGAAAAAWIRVRMHTPQMKFWASCGEAAACALLSTMLTECVRIFFPDLPDEIAMPIGIFTGWMGTDAITKGLVRVYQHFLPKEEPQKAEAKDAEERS